MSRVCNASPSISGRFFVGIITETTTPASCLCSQPLQRKFLWLSRLGEVSLPHSKVSDYLSAPVLCSNYNVTFVVGINPWVRRAKGTGGVLFAPSRPPGLLEG